jgi:hypothetical protein
MLSFLPPSRPHSRRPQLRASADARRRTFATASDEHDAGCLEGVTARGFSVPPSTSTRSATERKVIQVASPPNSLSAVRIRPAMLLLQVLVQIYEFIIISPLYYTSKLLLCLFA